MPAAVKRGENVNLICQYDLEGDTLYSMKWYKGKREFFRFTPKENPSLQIFPVPGIYVEVSFQPFAVRQTENNFEFRFWKSFRDRQKFYACFVIETCIQQSFWLYAFSTMEFHIYSVGLNFPKKFHRHLKSSRFVVSAE